MDPRRPRDGRGRRSEKAACTLNRESVKQHSHSARMGRDLRRNARKGTQAKKRVDKQKSQHGGERESGCDKRGTHELRGSAAVENQKYDATKADGCGPKRRRSRRRKKEGDYRSGTPRLLADQLLGILGLEDGVEIRRGFGPQVPYSLTAPEHDPAVKNPKIRRRATDNREIKAEGTHHFQKAGRASSALSTDRISPRIARQPERRAKQINTNKGGARGDVKRGRKISQCGRRQGIKGERKGATGKEKIEKDESGSTSKNPTPRTEDHRHAGRKRPEATEY